MSDESKTFESWAIVELFGHQQIAGLVTEATIGGCAFLRVDVPETNGRSAFTKFYGNGAIYSLTPCGEKEARTALSHIMPRPVSVYLVPDAPALPSRSQTFDDVPPPGGFDTDDGNEEGENEEIGFDQWGHEHHRETEF